MVTTFLFDRSLRESSSSKTSDLVVANVKDHRPVIGVRESLQSYLIKKRKHVSQHVWNWHIEELGKVVQAQLLSLQLPGSVPVLLQNLLSVLGFQPGTATRGDFMLMNNLAEVSTRTFGKDNQKKTERIFFFNHRLLSCFILTCLQYILQSIFIFSSRFLPQTPSYFSVPVQSQWSSSLPNFGGSRCASSNIHGVANTSCAREDFHQETIPCVEVTLSPLQIPSCAGTWVGVTSTATRTHSPTGKQ